MRRRRPLTLIAILTVAAAALVGSIVAGNRPQLGLDLQGGASVVLRAPDGADAEVLDQAIEVIRSRVDALGVAEPDITRQGDAIVVELPGVSDQQRAIEVIGQTAELRFRPVLGVLPPEGTPPETTTTNPSTSTTATTVAGEPTTTTTTVDLGAVPTTPPADNTADAEVVLPQLDDDGEVVARYRLGPTEVTGAAVEGAEARLQPGGVQWTVDLVFTEAGIDAFNALAATCAPPSATCPPTGVNNQTGQPAGSVAIELDGVVQSAPTINAAGFTRDQVVISGGFTEDQAKDLALVLRYGALPVQLEQVSASTVSASLGEDSLRAGIIAGALGTVLVLSYIVLYYRSLGLVVLAGLCVWAALVWSVVSYLGASRGLALSLAGATGLIVSVGITVDSYIVYFERLKDELARGRSVRSAVDRGFSQAFRTILTADTAAFIGAALLYTLTVGPVRGFALFLGLSTVLDVIVAYAFTRPLVATLARRGLLTGGFLSARVGAAAPATTTGGAP